MPLLHGGRIIIAPSDEEAIGQLLSEARVTAILMEGPEIYGLLEASLHTLEHRRTGILQRGVLDLPRLRSVARPVIMSKVHDISQVI